MRLITTCSENIYNTKPPTYVRTSQHHGHFLTFFPGQSSPAIGPLLHKPNVLLNWYKRMEWTIVSDNFHLRIHRSSQLYCHNDLQLTCHYCAQSEKHEDSNKYGLVGNGHHGLAHNRMSLPMVRIWGKKFSDYLLLKLTKKSSYVLISLFKVRKNTNPTSYAEFSIT